MEYKNALIGKTVTAVHLAADKQSIRFDVAGDETTIVARCDGDCCSHTWIEDVIDPEAVIGHEVISVSNLDLPESLRQKTTTDNYEEEMQYYGCAIETAGGRCTIAYRNSSNGYYGGSLDWPGESYYGGVHGQNVSTDEWKKLA